MQALIGNNLITKLKSTNKQYDVRDAKLKGFLIRVSATGKMSYVCQYGRGKRINIGPVGVMTPAQARDIATAILGDAAKGLDPRTKKNFNITLKYFIEHEYSPWIIAHRKVGVQTLSHIKRCFVSIFGNKSLNDLTPALFDQWRTQRLKEGSSKETVNRYIANFKAALSKAVLWGFIDVHPLEKLKLIKVDKIGKVRFLSHHEETRLRHVLKTRDEDLKVKRDSGNQWKKDRSQASKCLPDLKQFDFADHMTPMVLISINTGLRQGELFSLRWDNVSLDRALLTIEGAYAKSGKTRHLPLNKEALYALETWSNKSKKERFVFPSKNGQPFDNVKKAWSKILSLAQITNFRWHDMRHHFASKLVMAAVDLNTVRELLGHADMTMTLRYAHLAPEHKANAVERLVSQSV
jgi:integrase